MHNVHYWKYHKSIRKYWRNRIIMIIILDHIRQSFSKRKSIKIKKTQKFNKIIEKMIRKLIFLIIYNCPSQKSPLIQHKCERPPHYT